MKDVGEHWRWFSNTTWHYFSSMGFCADEAKAAKSDFMRYHHLRVCIYFAVGAIESYLNQEMRRHMEGKGIEESEIMKTLKRARIDEKIDKWPSLFIGHTVSLDPVVTEIFSEHKEIRNEVTHPKRRDHAIYHVLDTMNAEALVDAIATALVTLFTANGKPFPYWLHGWNYVGLSGDPSAPHESNNMNGFYFSLSGMGFSHLGDQMTFEKRWMSSLESYRILRDLLRTFPHDIEPFWPRFPMRPRMTRRWWDREYLLREHAEQMQNASA